LPECLSSIDAQTFQDFEVVVVDNASVDGSKEFIKENFARIKVVESHENRGFAGGNNLGIPHCTGKYVFFLNNDTRLDPNTLQELVNATLSHPKVSIFACFLLNYKEPDLSDSAGDTVYTNGVPFSFSRYPANMFSEPREVTAACAGAAMYSRKVLDSIGVFDEDFFLIFEDLDLSFRARHAGEKILFIPSAKVFHKGSASLGGKTSRLSLYYCERNIWLFYLKNFPMPILLEMLPALVIMKIFRLISAIRLNAFPGYWVATWRSICLFPKMWVKRKHILENSKISTAEFKQLLRKNWLKERLGYKKGRFDIPI
jgi:GT2 family glycosyltransferase